MKANALLDNLIGEKGANGLRAGGLLYRLTNEVKKDDQKLIIQMSDVIYLQWFLLIFGASISICIVFYITRSITRPIISANKHISKVALGDLTRRLDVNDKSELGVLIQNLNHNLIRVN